MAKQDDGMSKLNDVYNEILGEGPAIQDESLSTGRRMGDNAYAEEDYSDESGDGTDPRDVSGDTENQDDEGEADSYDEDDEDDVSGDNNEELKDDDYEPIPDRLVQAGRFANLSDEAIIELSESRPEALEALARAQEQAVQSQQKPSGRQFIADKKDDNSRVSDDASGFKPLSLEFDQDDEDEMGSKAMGIIKTLVSKVNELGGQIQEQSNGLGEIRQKSESEAVRKIDSFFDSMSKDIPMLGMTGKLSDEQKSNRRFAFRVAREAQVVYQNISDEDALAMGAKALKAQMKDAQIKANLVRDLDRNKRRFTARGTNRSRPPHRRSTQERALEAIDKVLSKQY